MAMVGCSGAERAKEGAPVRQGCEIAPPAGRVLARQFTQAKYIGDEVRPIRIDDVIRPKSRDDPALPAGLGEGRMMLERIQRAFGGRQHFDAEALVQGPRQKFRRGQGRIDGVEIMVGCLRAEADLESEHGRKDMIEPQPRRGCAKRPVVLGKQAP